MAYNAYAKRRAGLAPRATPAATPRQDRQPPSGALINVILEYADIRHELGDDPVIAGLLGRESARLADVSVLWDDDEGAIVRILDDRGAARSPDTRSDLDTFELTEAALAYVGRHGG